MMDLEAALARSIAWSNQMIGPPRPGTLLGAPVVEVEVLPDIEPVVFGTVIVDRGPYFVEIEEVATGRRALVPHYAEGGEETPVGTWGHFDDFQWSDGNYGCDCNRLIFFAHVLGLPDPPQGYPCSEGHYVVRSVRAPDGATVTIDWS